MGGGADRWSVKAAAAQARRSRRGRGTLARLSTADADLPSMSYGHPVGRSFSRCCGTPRAVVRVHGQPLLRLVVEVKQQSGDSTFVAGPNVCDGTTWKYVMSGDAET
jgi:hypothetical protein